MSKALTALRSTVRSTGLPATVATTTRCGRAGSTLMMVPAPGGLTGKKTTGAGAR